MGIVHHSNYIRYFECGRMAMLEEVGLPMHKIEEAGVMMPITEVECRYRVPAKLGDKLRVVTMINEMPRARLTVHTEIYNQNDQLLSTGSVTMGFIDAVTRRPIRCPQMLVDIFKDHINI
ncbi:MAG: acyl-CoA thioesterase [Bacteroidales bacterium]|nr:acyl-CoA thioesterase [Bacteroidales bacterium]